MKWIRSNKIKVVIFASLLVSFTWFLTREIQADLPYKLSGTDVLEIKEKCRILAETKESQWLEHFSYIELIGSGYSEKGGFCYMEYFSYYDDWTAKTLFNVTDEKNIIVRRWPDDEALYRRGFNWFINGKKKYYQNSF